MAPTRLGDGTNIDSIRLGDGAEIAEVRTGAGDTVFSAESLPVAYSNLVAWYPFDSSFYGGSNADDVTALFNPAQSGDSTAYDGSVSGATYQSSGGVTDISAGANSGAFDFDGSNDKIDLPGGVSDFIRNRDVTVTVWAKADFTSTSNIRQIFDVGNNERWMIGWSSEFRSSADAYMFAGYDGNVYSAVSSVSSINTGTYLHHAAVHKTNGDMEYYINGSLEATQTGFGSYQGSNDVNIGRNTSNSTPSWDGQIEDVRVYNRVLTASEISDIYNGTKP